MVAAPTGSDHHGGVTERLDRAFVVGMGEVGRKLAAALGAGGVGVRPVRRGEGWDGLVAEPGAAALVCVREEDLAGVLTRLAGRDPASVVLVQNGWIRPRLRGWEGCTRGLIWFTSKGEFFQVLRPSILGGPLAGLLADALGRGGVAAAAVGDAEFRGAEAEKMGFNCVLGLPLAVHRLSLAEYLAAHADEAEALFRESVEIPARALGVTAREGWWESFRRTVAPLGWVKAAGAKALEFRNGAVVRLAREIGAAAPVNARLLAAVGFRP